MMLTANKEAAGWWGRNGCKHDGSNIEIATSGW